MREITVPINDSRTLDYIPVRDGKYCEVSYYHIGEDRARYKITTSNGDIENETEFYHRRTIRIKDINCIEHVVELCGTEKWLIIKGIR